MNPAGVTVALPYRGKTSSIENMTESERQGGPGDHRVLLRGCRYRCIKHANRNAYAIPSLLALKSTF